MGEDRKYRKRDKDDRVCNPHFRRDRTSFYLCSRMSLRKRSAADATKTKNPAARTGTGIATATTARSVSGRRTASGRRIARGRRNVSVTARSVTAFTRRSARRSASAKRRCYASRSAAGKSS